MLWAPGQTSPSLTILCTRRGNVFDLTNQAANNISILLYNNVQTANINGQLAYTQIGTSAGSITIISSIPGIIQWAPAQADTGSLLPGQYWFRVKVNMNGTKPDYSGYLPLFIGA